MRGSLDLAGRLRACISVKRGLAPAVDLPTLGGIVKCAWKSRGCVFGLSLAAALLLASCDTPQRRALRELDHAGVEISGHALVQAQLQLDLGLTGLLLDAGVYTEQRDAHGRTPLRIAVENHDPQSVLRLIAAKADVSATTPDQVSVLGMALAWGNALVVEPLLTSGAHADGHMPDGETILPWAIRHGQLAWVRLMMQSGADPHLKDRQGNSLLHVAMDCGRRDLVDSLIGLGADPGALNASGESTLHFAMRRGWLDVVPRLIGGGADPNLPSPAGVLPLEVALHARDANLLGALLQGGADPNLPNPAGRTLLEQAIAARAANLLDRLLQGGANPRLAGASGLTPLEQGIATGDAGLVGVLLKRGADPNLPGPAGVTPLERVIAARDASLLGPLLQAGADPNRSGGTARAPAVHAVIRSRWLAGMRALAQVKANFNLPDAAGKTPLENAFAANDRELLGLLLSFGVDPGCRNGRAQLLVEVAAATGMGSAAKILLDYGSPAGNALYLACRRGDSGMAALLLACGVAPNACRPPTFDAPLGAALRAHNDALAAALVTHGASINTCLAEGQSALHLAIATGCHRTVKCLLERGANPNAPFRSPVSPAFIRQVRPGTMQWELRMDRNLTPLMLAADAGVPQTVTHLVAAGAKRSVATRLSQLGPLNFAAQREDVKTQRALLGEDPEREDRRIVICLSEQRARVYDLAGMVIFDSKVSTGRKGFATRTGDFVITDKYRTWTSTIYHASMPYFQRLSCADFGMHLGVVPGYPASHGCIRVPADKAPQLFSLTHVGDHVQILP